MTATGRIFVLSLLMQSILVQMLLGQNNWKFSNRLQMGASHDNNIFESVKNKESAGLASVIFQTHGRRQFEKFHFNYRISNGLQFYPEHSDEHKTTQIINAETIWPVFSKVRLSAAAGGTFKFFLNAPFDYILSYSALRLHVDLPWRLHGLIKIEGTQLEYAETNQFDFFNRDYEISLRRRLGNRFLLATGFSRSTVKFQRQALKAYEGNIFLPAAMRQRDTQRRIFARCTAGHRYLFRFEGMYVTNNSNSIGYAYSSIRFSGIGAIRVLDIWLLRMAVILQDKQYQAAIHPANLLEFDLERSETNSAIIDLSYDFNRDISALLRLSFYNNESRLRGRYFTKKMLFLGFEYRF